MVRRGQWLQRGGPENGGGGAKELSARPWLASSPQDPRGALGAEDTRAGRRGPDRGAFLLATAPARGGGAGAQERGRPGPGAARLPAAPRAARAALPGVRILGGSRGASLSSRQPARAARPRPFPLCRGWLRLGAGQLDHRGAAAGPWRSDRAAEGSERRQTGVGDQEAAAETLPPPFSSSRRRCRPPAWEWRGSSWDWLSVRAGATAAAFRLLRLGRRPAHEPRAPASSTHAPPARPRGFLNHRPRPLQPVGRRWPRESDQAERRMRAPRATSRQTGGRRESARGGGLGAPGRHLLRRGWGRVVTPRDRAAGRGRGQKICTRSGSLRREARKPAAPSFCNHAKPFPVFAGEGSSERVLMNGKARTEVARFSLQIVLGGGWF